MRVIDFFAGCGGLSLGFMNAGYDICAAFDNWGPAVETYRSNFDHPMINLDLGGFDGDITPFTIYAPEMVIGGPPCQDFSSAGKRDESLGRADLTIAYARIVSAIAPQWFVMENVERAIKTRAYAKARELLAEADYGLTDIILDASRCGVPQYRKRLFLIGERGGADNALEPYLLRNQTQHSMTLREYFGNSLGVDHYYRHPRSYARRGIFSVDEPSPTIRGVNRPIPKTYNVHPGDTAPVTPDLRPLTTKERWMIQTFPEHFKFRGSKSEIEQMVGNAVPVKLAQYVANCILDFIDSPIVTEQELHKAPAEQLRLL